MLRFNYRTFVWIFALSNAGVWFFIMFGVGHFIHALFAGGNGLPALTALAAFMLTPFVSGVLAAQGAIVNLRAQYLLGRFRPPAPARRPLAPPLNPWLAATCAAVPLAAILALIPLALFFLGLRAPLNAATTARGLGIVAATATMLLALKVADREFRRFHFHLGSVRRRWTHLGRYAWRRFGVPWAIVNFALNGLFAWMQYRQGPQHPATLVSLLELRPDLAIMTLLICVFMALATIPEVETDFAAGVTPTAATLPPMPPLWSRYALAGGMVTAVWLIPTMLAAALGNPGISLATTMALKATWGGVLAAAVSVQCTRWTLARCTRRAAPGFEVSRRAAGA